MKSKVEQDEPGAAEDARRKGLSSQVLAWVVLCYY